MSESEGAASVASIAAFLSRHPKACAKAAVSAIRRIYRNELSVLALESGSDKGPDAHNYSEVYGDYLVHRRNEPLVLVEVGLLMYSVQRKIGGDSFRDAPSLRMWRKYFPQSKIVGFDIADFSSVRIPGCTILRGDQSKREDLRKIASHCPDGADIIIDDALHASLHQQVTLAVLFPLIKPNGLYFIEDLHSQPKGTEVAGVPRTMDVLEMLSSPAHESASPSLAITNEEWLCLRQNIKSVRFYDSQKRTGGLRRQADAIAVLERR